MSETTEFGGNDPFRYVKMLQDRNRLQAELAAAREREAGLQVLAATLRTELSIIRDRAKPNGFDRGDTGILEIAERALSLTTDSVVEEIKEREAGLAALVERLREAMKAIPDQARRMVLEWVIKTGHDARSAIGDWALNTADCVKDDLYAILLDAGIDCDPPAALDNLRRREREKLLIELRMSGRFSRKACVHLGTLLDAIAAERHIADAGKKVEEGGADENV